MKKKARRPATPEELAQIAHQLPHRVRIRVPHIASRDEVCRRIAEELARSTNFHGQIRINTMTGSIVVEAPNQNIDATILLARLRECVDDELRRLPEIESGPTKIAATIARAFAKMNADLRGGLHHRADLAALLPIGLASLAIVQLVTTGSLTSPSWFNFGWWSFRAFMTFHKNASKEGNDEMDAPNSEMPPPA